jgi:hypothetical protein
MSALGHEPVTLLGVDFYLEHGLRLGFSWTDPGGPDEDWKVALIWAISFIQEEAVRLCSKSCIASCEYEVLTP